MDIQSIIESGQALNVVIDSWKKNAIEFVLGQLKKRKNHILNVRNYEFSVSPKLKSVSICGSEKLGVSQLFVANVDGNECFIVEDGDGNWYNSHELTMNDLVKILRIIKAVQKADDAAKDF